MKLVDRPYYISALWKMRNTPDIKVISGMRRSGKSCILNIFLDKLKKEDADSNIIKVDFNSPESESLNEYHRLYEYIESQYVKEKNNVVAIDEVQMCSGFEKAVNYLQNSGKYDIYITESNAFLLSSDLATLFTGRTMSLMVFPFSFAEFSSVCPNLNIDERFEKYVLEGGMPGALVYEDFQTKANYNKEVFNALIVRDIQTKYKIRNKSLLTKLVSFLMDNISNPVSIRSIAAYLSNSKDEVNHKTISSYIDYLCKAFSFYKINRFDIQGKKYLASQEKYYLCDHAIKYSIIGTKNMNYGRIYENIVAIELLRRGYEIYTGKLYKKEIDFVAIKQNEKLYIQVSDDVSKEDTFSREIIPLQKINDSYPKMLIANTKHQNYDYEGIQIVDLARWLVNY